MKKTLLLTIAFSLILGLAIVVKAEGLEKIPNPSEIKNFDKIIKKETSLWGYRKKASSTLEKKEIRQGDKKNATEEMKGDLEKIISLDEVRYFKNIRKVGTSLWGIRKEPKRSQSVKSISASSTPCVIEAINAKDTILKEAISAYSQKLIAALDTRNACQIAALGSAEQFSANKICANAYQTEVKAINKDVNKTRNEAWKTYTKELQVCIKPQITSTSTPEVLNLEDGGAATTTEDVQI